MSGQLSPLSPAPPIWCPPWRRKPDGPLCGLLFAVSLVVFANSISNGFVFDDVFIIQDNTRLDRPWDLPLMFGTDYWGEGEGGRLYRPLTIWSFALDRFAFGPEPLGVHLVNVVTNALLVVAVYVLLLSLSADRRLSFLAALFYGLHPVHTEVVANGVGRAELGAALAMCLAALLHLAWLRGPASASPGRARSGGDSSRTRDRCRRGAAVFYLVAMLFKESAILLPLLLFLGDWLVVAEGRLRVAARGLRDYGIYALPLLIYGVVRFQVVGLEPAGVHEVIGDLSAGDRSLLGLETMGQYVGQLIFPLWLCADYSDFRIAGPFSTLDSGVWAGAGASALLAVLAVVASRAGHHMPAFGLAWVLVALLPFSNVLVPMGTVRADRLLFVPSLGFCIALGWTFVRVLDWRRQLAWLLLAVTLGFYGWRTITRNAQWYSQDTLWLADIERNPGNPLGWFFVGDARRHRGELAEAEAAYLRAIELRESRAGLYTNARRAYGSILRDQGRGGAASAQYRLILEHEPRDYKSLTNLGEILMTDSETRAEAIALLRRAIEARPEELAPRGNLAQALRLSGQLEEATGELEEALELHENDARLWRLYAEVLGEGGRDRERSAALRRAAALVELP